VDFVQQKLAFSTLSLKTLHVRLPASLSRSWAKAPQSLQQDNHSLFWQSSRSGSTATPSCIPPRLAPLPIAPRNNPRPWAGRLYSMMPLVLIRVVRRG
jgi:hypothetical protein